MKITVSIKRIQNFYMLSEVIAYEDIEKLYQDSVLRKICFEK